MNKIELCRSIYPRYFALNIHQRINERSQRDGLNVLGLFGSVLSQEEYAELKATHPQINNGVYHHIGRHHSQYPGKNHNRKIKNDKDDPFEPPFVHRNISIAYAAANPTDKIDFVINTKVAVVRKKYTSGEYDRPGIAILHNNTAYWYCYLHDVKRMTALRMSPVVCRETGQCRRRSAKMARQVLTAIHEIK